MKTLIQYIDDAKEKSGSDYATAKEIGVSKQAISHVRSGRGVTNETAAKLAVYLGVELQVIVAASESVKHPEKAEFWGKWVAAGVAFFAAAIWKYPVITMGYEIFSSPYYILCKMQKVCSRLCTGGRYMVPCS